MSLDDHVLKMNAVWMQGVGPDEDVVISSRIRLARNLKDVPFPGHLEPKQAQEMLMRISSVLTSGTRKGDLGSVEVIPMSGLDGLNREVLVEKHLISPDLAATETPGAAVALRNDEAVSIMVNEEDHIRLQVILPGMQVDAAYRLASRLDDMLEAGLDYAFDDQLGFLTACPTNLGTGMRASVMLHTPGLAMSGQMPKVLSTIGQVGLVARGLYGEGSQSAGNMIQISNQITLGMTEEDIISNLSAVVGQIVAQERQTRTGLRDSQGLALEDRVWRSYGTLRYARALTSQEALDLLSDVRLGADYGWVRVPRSLLNELTVSTQKGTLQKITGRVLGPTERDKARADYVRSQFEKLRGEESV
jgi:protein arginine kinase